MGQERGALGAVPASEVWELRRSRRREQVVRAHSQWSPRMKTFATATLLALLAIGAMAQQPAPSTQQPGSPPAARTAQPPTQEAKGPWLASAFMRSSVYNMAGERI